MKQDEQLVEKELADGLEQVVGVRSAGIAEARNVQLALHVLLEHEAARLTGKLGPEHPRTVATRLSLQAQRALVNALAVESELTTIRVPKVNENQALVHGRVVDRDNRGFTELTVSLVDKAGDAPYGIEPAATDASGYYAIVLQGEAAKATAYLEVTSPRGTRLHRGKQPLRLEPGARLSVDVTLARGDVFDFRGEAPKSKPAGRRKKAGKAAKRKER